MNPADSPNYQRKGKEKMRTLWKGNKTYQLEWCELRETWEYI